MGKRAPGKYEKQIAALKIAELNEYNRLVLDNQALQTESLALRRKYNLSSTDERGYMDWIDRQVQVLEEKVMRGELSEESYRIPSQEFENDVAQLISKHGLQKFHRTFEGSTILGPIIELFKYGHIITEGYFTLGHPQLSGDRLGPNETPLPGARWRHIRPKFVYPATFDPTNPILQARAERLVLEYVDPIPQPSPTRGNLRKLDWAPVWEWEKRHPTVSRKQIAQMLGRNAVAVRRKLAELDQDLTPRK